jgi:uncharacterized protein with FMN-binding domain
MQMEKDLMSFFDPSGAIKTLCSRFFFVLSLGWFVCSVWAGDSTRQEISLPKSGIRSGEEKQLEAGEDSASVGKISDVLKDGIYIGVSEGWTGMKTEVTIEKGRIANIKVLEISGTQEFYTKVIDLLPGRIVSKGSLEVDGVSGATLSSNSMKEAVGHALEKARQSQ